MIKRSIEGVWMATDDESVSRQVAIEAMNALSLDCADWRVRDRVIMAIRGRVNGCLDDAFAIGRRSVGPLGEWRNVLVCADSEFSAISHGRPVDVEEARRLSSALRRIYESW